MSQTLPPNSNQLEVSIFGPGYGEAILIHLGDGKWITIDSCVDDINKKPKAVAYLESMGYDPATCIKLVIATHWHDDHVAGLARLLDSSSEAVFCCPVSLSSREFLGLATLYKGAPVGRSSAFDELRGSLEIAIKRSHDLKKQMLRNMLANTQIYIDAINSIEVQALSPSDHMVIRCTKFMAGSHSAALASPFLHRVVPSIPNDVATAIRVKIAGREILLGSDLEEMKDPLVGWQAVVLDHVRPTPNYTTFKVAHHGSKSGHNNDVWSKLLHPNPLSLISPFKLGRHKLPTPNDISRILSLTRNAYITSNHFVDVKPKAKKLGKVEALIEKSAKNRRLAIGNVGHVRWRADINTNDAGNVELFDGALLLKDVA